MKPFKHLPRANNPLTIVIVLVMLIVTSSIALAEVSIPQIDQTPLTPLAIPNPATADPRYLSGFGVDNDYTIFYEDRADTALCTYGARIYFVQTVNGPLNFSAPVPTSICDTHLVVKNWPVTISGSNYNYRAWGAIGNNPQHNFYVSNDLVNWVRNPGTTPADTPFTFNDPSGLLNVYYGFHDIVRINGNYIGFAETNGARTVIVWSNLGTNSWDVIDVVGGSGVGPLNLDVGGTGPTPTGSFVLMEVNGQQVYGKLGVPGNDSGAYLAINRAAAQASTPTAAESAFLDPANWTWSDNSTGIPGVSNQVLSASGVHDVREVWSVPLSNYRSDHVIFYTGRYGGGSDLGCAASNPECLVVDPPPVVLPATGFSKQGVTNLAIHPEFSPYHSFEMTLEIPDLKIQVPIVGVPRSENGWDVTWLGQNAGYLSGSAFPTWNGNTVITGHVWDAYNQPGPFAEIKSLSFGDEIKIHSWGKTYTYEVKEKTLLLPSQANSAFSSEEYDWITLITCEFYNPISDNYIFRRAVKAVLVDVK